MLDVPAKERLKLFLCQHMQDVPAEEGRKLFLFERDASCFWYRKMQVLSVNLGCKLQQEFSKTNDKRMVTL